MSISPLVTKIIPADSTNYTAGRNGTKISEITLHHVAGVTTIESLGEMWQNPARNGSSAYGVSEDNIGCYVSEGDIAWTNNNWSANCRAVTIEVSNSGGAPSWPISDKSLNTTIKLVADIAKRNNLGKLVVGQNLTMHKQYAATACPGPYLEGKFEHIAEQANIINGYEQSPEVPVIVTEEKTFIDLLVPLAQEDQKQNNILASLTLAQAILESDYGRSELAQNANNMFGIKAHGDWEIYSKATQEWDGSKYITITADFAKYTTTKEGIQDHADKLTVGWAAENYYKGVVGESDITKALHCIEKWATAPDYVSKLQAVVDKWNLTQYDLPMEELPEVTPSEYEQLVGQYRQLEAVATNLAHENEAIKSKISEAVAILER